MDTAGLTKLRTDEVLSGVQLRRQRQEEAEADAFAAQVQAAKTDEEREREQADAVHAQHMQVVRDYIETCGAPEEKDQVRVEETFLQMLQRKEDEEQRGVGIPGNALKIWAEVIQDPDDEGAVHVYTMKTDAQGKAKVTRHMEFNSGDGEDRSQLTPERARARKIYEKQMAGGETTTHKDKDEGASV